MLIIFSPKKTLSLGYSFMLKSCGHLHLLFLSQMNFTIYSFPSSNSLLINSGLIVLSQLTSFPYIYTRFQLWQRIELGCCFLCSWGKVLVRICVCLQSSPFFTTELFLLVPLLGPIRKWLNAEHVISNLYLFVCGKQQACHTASVEVRGQLMGFSFQYSIEQTQVVKLDGKPC